MKSKVSKPLIIIGCPRSGTTLLFTLLSASKELFSLYDESRFIFREFYLKKEKESVLFFDDALQDSDLTESDELMIRDLFDKHSFRTRNFGLFINKFLRKNPVFSFLTPLFTTLNIFLKSIFSENYRLVEKTPRNCFKIGLINKLYPDAHFVYIKRDPRSNISSLMEGWRNRKEERDFDETKRMPKLNMELKLKNFPGKTWRFALPPGWQDYAEKNLEEICAYQWLKSNQAVQQGLEAIPTERKMTISYEDLCEDSYSVIKKICNFADLEFSEKMQKLSSKPPQVNYLDSKPSSDKWKKNEKEIESILPMVEEVAKDLGYE